MSWRVGSELSHAQLVAAIAAADAGVGNACLRTYTSDRPATLGGAVDAPQAVIVLAKPCGTVVDGVLVLHALDDAGAMVATTGLPRWGEWVSAGGVVLTDGTVTDMAHDGDIRLAGGETPAGETSPMLYAGGLVLLGETALT